MSGLIDLFTDILGGEIRPDSPCVRPSECGVDIGDSPQSPDSPRGSVETAEAAPVSCWWLVHFDDRAPLEVCFSPAATHAEVLASYPAATAAQPFEPAPGGPSAPMRGEDEPAVRSWLALIKETDPATIAEVLSRCEADRDARAYFVRRAAYMYTGADA